MSDGTWVDAKRLDVNKVNAVARYPEAKTLGLSTARAALNRFLFAGGLSIAEIISTTEKPNGYDFVFLADDPEGVPWYVTKAEEIADGVIESNSVITDRMNVEQLRGLRAVTTAAARIGLLSTRPEIRA
jgi:hypothetical protein